MKVKRKSELELGSKRKKYAVIKKEKRKKNQKKRENDSIGKL